jgi:beta-lactamase superfamily II metal-dependent hydrolase
MSLYEESRTASHFDWRRLLMLAAVAGAALLALAWLARPDGYLHVFFLDTPGDAVLVQTPHGGYVLVDGGADPTALALHLGRLLPFWQRHLDAVILTEGDAQRTPGQVAALTRYRAAWALAAVPLPATPNTREWVRLLDAQGTTVHAARQGETLALGDMLITVLADGTDGNSGLVLRLDYGATSVVLQGAASTAADARLLAAAQPTTVLAYPWQRPVDAALLDAWQPQAIVFTDAQEEQRPAQQTFYERAQGDERLYQNLYHPELDGTVELVSNGRDACIRRAHEPPCMLP